MPRLLLLTVLCTLLVAQQQTPPQEPPATGTSTVIKTSVDSVVAPVWVYDRAGSLVDGLRPDQFHLFDNNKEQNIQVDVAFQPISLVICIQANAKVDKILPQVNRIGNLISPLILGERGEAAVIAYDHRIKTLQDFTSDPDKITVAVKKIYAGSTASHMVDAVVEGTRMLRSRPADHRRIILLIGETRDYGSEIRAREALVNLQMSNVTLFSVNMSRLMTTLTSTPEDPRPDNLPPAMHPMPPGVAATPTSVMQTYGTEGSSAQFIPLMVEIFKDAKAIFKANPVEVFTKGTGGEEFDFFRQRGLEDSIQKLGTLLHAEYMITYTPNNKMDGGFHEIKVQVSAGNVKEVKTRPGYWLASKQ